MLLQGLMIRPVSSLIDFLPSKPFNLAGKDSASSASFKIILPFVRLLILTFFILTSPSAAHGGTK
jgi:hypothetical protein